jgi:hypothetical protein
MSRTKRYFLVPLLVIMLSIPSFVVFAKELTLLTISGPGIKGEAAFTDQKLIMTMEQAGFFDQTGLVQAPKNLNTAAGYTITANLNLDGQVVPYVQLVYYAADQGQPGYVHYTGRLVGDALQPVDEWQRLTSNADNRFRALMSANSITLQTALVTVPAAVAPVSTSKEALVLPAVVPTANPLYIALAAAAVLLLAGAGLVLRRRSLSHTTA